MQPNPNMPPGMQPPMQPGMQPPMQPGMPGMYPPMPGQQPMQPGMIPPNAFDYRNQNFNNYQMQTHYKMDKDQIKKHAESLFQKYDADRSGNLQIYELGGLLNEYSAMNGQPPVNPKDVEYIMYNFDQDHSGTIDFKEFKMILKMLSGHKSMDKEKIKEKKQKRKNKMGKEGKDKKHKESKEKKEKKHKEGKEKKDKKHKEK